MALGQQLRCRRSGRMVGHVSSRLCLSDSPGGICLISTVSTLRLRRLRVGECAPAAASPRLSQHIPCSAVWRACPGPSCRASVWRSVDSVTSYRLGVSAEDESPGRTTARVFLCATSRSGRGRPRASSTQGLLGSQVADRQWTVPKPDVLCDEVWRRGGAPTGACS